MLRTSTDAEIGDVATIYGTDGKQRLPANLVARSIGTVTSDLLCAVSQRRAARPVRPLKPLKRLLRSYALLEVHSEVCESALVSVWAGTAPTMSRIAAILPAAGLGTRMGAETPKQFLELDGTPIVIHSLRRIASCALVTDIIVATRADEVARLEERIAKEKFKQTVRVVKGGDSRQDSVAAALREVPKDTEIVLVHDAVRPFVTAEQIARVIEEARRCEAAILGHSGDGHGERSEARQLAGRRGADYGNDSARTRGAGADAAGICDETPEGSVCAGAGRRRECFGRSGARGTHGSRCACGARVGTQYENHEARGHGTGAILSGTRAQEGMSTRCGIGYDLHRLEEGRKLIVGGIELPFEKGPVGHSDGDVLAHALCDALLGAAGLGDIGTHFPDTDPKWKGANSLLFLEHARKLLDEKHFVIEHVDAVVITEKPKLGPHFPKMREALAQVAWRTGGKDSLESEDQ